MKSKVVKQHNVPKHQKYPGSQIKIMYTNADQMTPKNMDELRHDIRTHKPHLVAVCRDSKSNLQRI